MDALRALLEEISSCQICAEHLDLGPRPVLRAEVSARVLIIGQAPGARVHESGIPWNDNSGERLRQWMDVTTEVFYDASRIAIMPMGFCYPGRNPKGGDMPPRPECAPKWHSRVLDLLPNVELTLLVGGYAQAHPAVLGFRPETSRMQIREKATACFVVCVRNVVSGQRAFACDLTDPGHREASCNWLMEVRATGGSSGKTALYTSLVSDAQVEPLY